MEGQVILILLFVFSFSFSLPVEDIEEDPADELEHLLESENEEDRGCRDISLYWCRGYSSRCSHRMVYSNCPKTCGKCLDAAGGWSAWSGYGACSKSCHYGYQSRSRECNSPSSLACQGPSVHRRRCNEHVRCPSVRMGGSSSALKSGEGKWTPWGAYTKCTKSCGTGTQSRTRTCINPSQPFGHKRCPGPFRQHRPCNIDPCPVDGGWTSWGPFRHCSKSCGGGSQYKHRKCKNPPPKHGGKLCHGPFTLSRECNMHVCAVDGHWSSWGAFGSCSRSCGGGIQYRRRACNNPAPSGGGKNCPGPSHQSNACNMQACSVDGHWSSWGVFGACSRSCGGGTQYRRRACNNPAPSGGGNNCPGPSYQSNACNTQQCSVDGHWSSWGVFGACSRSCGGGTQYRRRACNNPAPSGGGKNCPGPSHQSNACNTQQCPVDGHWSSWGVFGACSRSCGGGTQYRRRACNNPAPSGGGKNCPGPSHQSNACNTQQCSVDGHWSSWGVFRACSRSCGGGTQYRSRACNNPAPSGGGKNCPGPSHQSNACNAQACAVHGHWSPWGIFGACTKSCGGGMKYRSRTCNNPAPSSGGQMCLGPSQESMACNTHLCSVDGQWSQWSIFGSCSQSCGGGFKHRTRKCNSPAPSKGGKACKGASFQSIVCNVQGCPVHGGWSSWGSYSSCSHTCGSAGRQTRQRSCTNPAPANGGRGCPGDSSQTRGCSSGVPCPQLGCKDIQSYAYCRYVMMSYSCGYYYRYCRKTCNTCNYLKAY